MNLAKYFIKEVPTAGLYYNDNELRLVLLEKSVTGVVRIAFVLEEPFPPGDVINGHIINKKGFSEILTKLLEQTNKKFKAVILSLPPELVYCRIFDFPVNMTGDKLENSIKLAANFQLPQKAENLYLDWQSIPSQTKNQVLVAAAEKLAVDELLNVVTSVGLEVVAVEFEGQSIARIVDLPPEQSIMIATKNQNTSLVIIKNKLVRFLHQIPNLPVADNALMPEIDKLAKYYEAEDTSPVGIAILNEGLASLRLPTSLRPITLSVNLIPGAEHLPSAPLWFPALGAAWRGLTIHSEGKAISLMAIGTEETFVKQQVVVFTSLLAKLAIAISIILTIAFGATWILFIRLQANYGEQVQSYNSKPIDSNASELEAKAMDFNTGVNQGLTYYKEEVLWSRLLKELNSRINNNIKVSKLSATSPEQIMTLTGSAATRQDLSLLKKSLEESSLLINVILPLANLDKKADIPFTITFSLKNPNELYPN